MKLNRIKKETVIDILIGCFITFLTMFAYFRNPTYAGHDLEYHLNRFYNLGESLFSGQFPVRVYPYMNNGFGYAAPLFYCDLFLYPFALLYKFGVSTVWCFKLCIIFYTLLGNLFVYRIIKKETKNRLISLLAVLLFTSANYHLQNVYIRCALGEVLAMTFTPLVIHSIYKILVKHENSWVYLGVSFSLLLMSHLISTLLYGIFFFIMIVVFIFINHKDKALLKKTFITILKGTVLAIFLTAWYLLPMLEQLHSQDYYMSYYSGTGTIDDYKTTLLNVLGLMVCENLSTYRIEYQASSGILLNLFLIASFFVKRNKYVIITSLYCLVLYLIVLQIIPGSYLNIIQFYFRLYVVTFPLLVGVGIYCLSAINTKKYKTIIYTLVLLISLFNLYNINYQVINNGGDYIDNNVDIKARVDDSKQYITNMNWNPHDISNAEYLPYTNRVNFNTDSKAIKYLNEDGYTVDYIYEYDREYTTITFTCNNQEDISLLIPLTFYKGYAAYELIDDKWVITDYTNNYLYRELQINSNAGKHTYKVTYVGTTVQKVSLIISTVSLLILCIYYFKKQNKDSKTI